MDSRKPCLIAGVRTAFGRFGGALSNYTVDQLGIHTTGELITRIANLAGINQDAVAAKLDGVVRGHGFQSSLTPNLARFEWLNAGLPAHVPAKTVQRQCGSGMEVVHDAMREIMLGNGKFYIVGGDESMSTVPYVADGRQRFHGRLYRLLKRFGKEGSIKFGPRPVILAEDGLAPAALRKDLNTNNMSATADLVADVYKISRQDADAFALRSHKLAHQATESGRFAAEIVGIAGKSGYVLRDEHIRADTTMEGLAKLKGAFGARHVTAGNASGINDGSCSLAVSSVEFARQLGVQPMAILEDFAVAGVDAHQMGLGPVAAIRKLLGRNSQLKLSDIPVVLINEAFAVQVLACVNILGLDLNRVNPNGGAIALGHPIAVSGARLVLEGAFEIVLKGYTYVIAALCIGGGMGIATLLKKPTA